MGVRIAKTTQTHKEKPLKWLEQDWKHDKAINMPKDDSWLSMKNGEEALTELNEWARVFATIKRKN